MEKSLFSYASDDDSPQYLLIESTADGKLMVLAGTPDQDIEIILPEEDLHRFLNAMAAERLERKRTPEQQADHKRSVKNWHKRVS